MARRLLLALTLVLALAAAARAGETEDWATLCVVRFGNIDAIDAEDGDLAQFIKSIRNDGRFIPPLHTLIGPEIRNNTFYGLTYEGWLECLVLAPAAPGPVERLWVFPVDNRDEYMTQLANLGLSEYEGMDGVTRLRELGPDGTPRTWYMEWLPGNVAIFGSDRGAVAAARRIYAENIAARGLLHQAGGRYVEPDVTIRFEPARLVAWQDREMGVYWWREKIGKLTDDLVNFWQPGPARERLLRALAERFTLWPRSISGLDLTVWFEREGVEWRLAVGGEPALAGQGELGVFRQTPERSALAYALPVGQARFRAFGEWTGELLLGAAGGVVSRDVRAVAASLFASLEASGPTEAASCWVSPPQGRPELGGARVLIADFAHPARLDEALAAIREHVQPDTAVAHAFDQMGVAVSLEPYPDLADTWVLRVRPADGGDAPDFYHGGLVLRRSGARLVAVTGAARLDADQMRRVMDYRAALAAETLAYRGPGLGDVQLAFSRMGAGGTGLLAVFHPVRFLQLCLVETADWRPRSPDQHEPLSTQLAREMLEYGHGRAWTLSGDGAPDGCVFTGGIPWQSLARLSAALGITESISME